MRTAGSVTRPTHPRNHAPYVTDRPISQIPPDIHRGDPLVHWATKVRETSAWQIHSTNRAPSRGASHAPTFAAMGALPEIRHEARLDLIKSSRGELIARSKSHAARSPFYLEC